MVQPIEFVDESGIRYGIKHIGNKPRTVNQPYMYAIAEGEVPGHSIFAAFGHRHAVQVVAKGEDVWGGTAAEMPFPIAAGEQLLFVSDDDEDSAAGGVVAEGSGLRTLEMDFLDENGDPQSETVTLDGTTVVSATYATIRFVQRLTALTAGSDGSAVGNIICYQTGDATRIYKQIAIGERSSIDTFRMVPLGKTFFATAGYATATEKSIEQRLMITAKDGVLRAGIFIEHGTVFLQDSAFPRTFSAPIKCPALSMIKMTTFVPAGKAGGFVSAGYEGWLE